MKTYHVHIRGIVQGVGFRPFVYKYCIVNNITGWVNNTADGVHLHLNTSSDITTITKEIQETSPKKSTITSIEVNAIDYIGYKKFDIIHTETKGQPNLLLTPDFSLCKNCEKEIKTRGNNRENYPFTTCTDCGPRYSIIESLPYDRLTTTMQDFEMCQSCTKEYNDPLNRRYYSQTNSCPDCGVKLHLYENGILEDGQFSNLDYIVDQWNAGKIIAIKGIGGYLLTCDATNTKTIQRLRKIKNRPTKPFALMYHDIYELGEDTEMGIGEMLELEDAHSPIVLLSIKKDRMTPLDMNAIAPNLSILGVMMPYTPLFKILLDKFKKPIVATSGNISGSTIIFEDNIQELSKIADILLTNNRKIVIPQDDSIIRYSSIKMYRTIIRRSRGMAPSYINPKLKLPNTSILATGAMLKSTFTLLNNKNIHISQYLGNTTTYDAELNYKKTWNHFENLFRPKLKVILTDLHPNYFSSQFGKELAQSKGILHHQIQHHKAHFFAVMGENNLLDSQEKILGVIWDGTGLGDDNNIWGGEFFSYQKGETKRVFHLNEFPFILGDKMPKEPRISALAMAPNNMNNNLIKNKFTTQEWKIYQKLKNASTLRCTSIGRLFDAVASILLGIDKQTYEGEAAMRLESAAYRYFRANNFTKYYSYFKEEELPRNFNHFIIKNILSDLDKGFEKDFIAAKFHISLAHYLHIIAKKQGVKKIVFSGGVFQNQWLIELILSFMDKEFELFFHKNLSPNDENISFGQLMYYLYSQDL